MLLNWFKRKQYYELDVDKIKTVEDLVAIMKVLQPIHIHIRKKDLATIRHLLK